MLALAGDDLRRPCVRTSTDAPVLHRDNAAVKSDHATRYLTQSDIIVRYWAAKKSATCEIRSTLFCRVNEMSRRGIASELDFLVVFHR